LPRAAVVKSRRAAAPPADQSSASNNSLTIHQLGYPTKNALKRWYREYEQHIDLPAGYTRQAKYTLAQRERAVHHYLENGRCIAATIRALG